MARELGFSVPTRPHAAPMWSKMRGIDRGGELVLTGDSTPRSAQRPQEESGSTVKDKNKSSTTSSLTLGRDPEARTLTLDSISYLSFLFCRTSSWEISWGPRVYLELRVMPSFIIFLVHSLR